MCVHERTRPTPEKNHHRERERGDERLLKREKDADILGRK